jgi:hypothetical protein
MFNLKNVDAEGHYEGSMFGTEKDPSDKSFILNFLKTDNGLPNNSTNPKKETPVKDDGKTNWWV